MPDFIETMDTRELAILDVLEFISDKTHGFEKPMIITIGGYALRAYIPFSRYTRDCDFVLRKENGWHLDEISRWISKKIDVEVFRKEGTYAFLKVIKHLDLGRKSRVRISIDLMEGEVRGRSDKEVILIDEGFIQKCRSVRINVAKSELGIFVPSYTDFLILKLVSARPSDIRDLAALIWKNGIPEDLHERIEEILPFPDVIDEKLKGVIIPDLSNDRFVDSWRGTFIATEFGEKEKEEVRRKIEEVFGR